MDFDVVIATRNRPDALTLTLPLLMAQSRPPAQIIIVDSSDDPAPVDRAVGDLARNARVPIHLIHSHKGSSQQRNIGLARVTAPVVFLPDDDSLLYPGTTEAMMRIYERDTAGLIAGVCPADAPRPPPGVDLGASYGMSAEHAARSRNMWLRYRVQRVMPDFNPFVAFGWELHKRTPVPDWLAEEQAVRVEWMTGYRMSFRTDLIRAAGFDETFQGYGLYEDIDASFAVAREGALIGVESVAIYHHRFPGGRPNRYALAAMSIVNRGYVMAKHTAAGLVAPAVRQSAKAKIRNYARLRMAALLPKLRREEARADFRGTRAGLAMLDRLFAAAPADLPAAYRAITADLGLD